MPVERSEPGVPGLCDYARNDEVEDPTLCGSMAIGGVPPVQKRMLMRPSVVLDMKRSA